LVHFASAGTDIGRLTINISFETNGIGCDGFGACLCDNKLLGKSLELREPGDWFAWRERFEGSLHERLNDHLNSLLDLCKIVVSVGGVAIFDLHNVCDLI
jgi:hypothetical protein